MTQSEMNLPMIGFGTYKVGGPPGSKINAVEVFNAIDSALEAGYRYFDCAQFYENEAEIGSALQKLLPKYKLMRSDIFITSKVWPDKIYQGPEAVLAQLQKSIADLDCGYCDFGFATPRL